jgi:Domain of unknown function (DUF1737)
MEKIDQYAILSSADINNLQEAISKKISDGWQPFGNIVISEIVTKPRMGRVTERTYCQPIVKYESQKP